MKLMNLKQWYKGLKRKRFEMYIHINVNEQVKIFK